MFHLFPDLPAELRVRIWHVALEDDYDDLNGRNRIIELHDYNPTLKTIAVTVSRRYPTLFEVNREARCEAAKAGGGEWITVKATLKGRQVSRYRSNFDMYINLSQDIVFLSSRFISLETSREETRITHTTSFEERNIQFLINVLPYRVVKKIAYLMLTSVAERGPPWSIYRGKLLELFTALKHIHLQAHRHTPYLGVTRQDVAEHVRRAWEKRGTEIPHVSCFPVYLVEDRKTLIWLIDSGVEDVESDGIRRVEWGFRKDLWVPRAKKGLGTLQRIG